MCQPVAPFAGAWIEIASVRLRLERTVQSLPSRERGLKYFVIIPLEKFYLVAPFAGAWIEIELSSALKRLETVAPFAGAWIEIFLL